MTREKSHRCRFPAARLRLFLPGGVQRERGVLRTEQRLSDGAGAGLHPCDIRINLEILDLQVFNSALGVQLKKRVLKPGASTKLKITAFGQNSSNFSIQKEKKWIFTIIW